MVDKKELVKACQKDINSDIQKLAFSLQGKLLTTQQVEDIQKSIVEITANILTDEEAQFMYNMYHDPVGVTYISKLKTITEEVAKTIMKVITESKSVLDTPYSMDN